MSQNDKPLIEVKNVSKKYCRNLKRSLKYGLRDLGSELMGRSAVGRMKLRPGEFFSVRNVSFQVKQGECVALLGPNGAGKSTLLKMLAGLFKPDVGRIRIRGRMGALIELGTGFNPVLSGRENVYVNGAILGLDRAEVDKRFDEILDFSEVSDVIDEPVRTYSSGMRLRLGFAVAAHMRPNLLLVDEVLAVGDVGFRMKCFKHIQDQVASGMSLIIVSHSIGQLNRVATRALVMNKHQLVHDGDFVEGATLYEKILNAKKEKRKKESKDTVAVIKEIRILPEGDEPHFETGQTISAEIEVRAKEAVKNARMRIYIDSARAGVLGGFSSPHQDFHFDINPGKNVIGVELLRIPLLMGGYTLNATISGPELVDFLDRHYPGPGFEIVGPRTDSNGYGEDGIVRFEHRWKRIK
jgi:lipopolysaccharide transport system ATP-binding protein